MPTLPESSDQRIGVWWVGVHFTDGTRTWGNLIGQDEHSVRRRVALKFLGKSIEDIRTEHVCNLGFKDATNQV